MMVRIISIEYKQFCLIILQSEFNQVKAQMQETFASQHFNLLCDAKNSAQLLCSSQNCYNCALLCRQSACVCLPRKHEACEFVYADNFIKKVLSKRKEMNEKLKQAANAVQNIYEQAIDRLSRDRESFLLWRDYYGLNPDQIQFVSLLVSTQGKQLTGDKVYRVKSKLSQRMNTFFSQRTIKNFWKRQQKQFNKIFDAIHQFYQVKKHKLDSAIIQQQVKIQKLYQFLEQPVDQMKLLYRASQHQFSTAEFHKKCDGVGQTVTLAKTQFDKIIGGYTPFPWKATDGLQSTEDPQKKSFLFSLNLEQKYPVVGVKHALGHHASCGPCFGRFQNDIGISDKSNTSDKSLCDFPNQYNNGKYNKCQSTTQQFCGAKKGNKVKFIQWQIFEVRWTFPQDSKQEKKMDIEQANQ